MVDPEHTSKNINPGDYSKYCALVEKEGWLRFITFDLDEKEIDTTQKIFITIHARLHDRKYKTDTIEFCRGFGRSILELVSNALVPFFSINLDNRIEYPLVFDRKIKANHHSLFQLKLGSPLYVSSSSDTEFFCASLSWIKILRFQNQIFHRLTSGEYGGAGDKVIKLAPNLFNSQRPLCAPSLGPHLVTDHALDSSMIYIVPHEMGHGIMWQELNISFRRLAWEFIAFRWMGGDYISNHAPFYETNFETALYEGWADFCSMFTDWTDGTEMRWRSGSSAPIGPKKIKLLDQKIWEPFPPSNSNLNNNPRLANIGERCEGVISNLLWTIWESICGGKSLYANKVDGNPVSGSTPSLPYGAPSHPQIPLVYVYFRYLAEPTTEHIEENVYTDEMCDKFKKYIWKPFKTFWYDEEGNCNLRDYWDPSIRDFINAIIKINGKSDPNVQKIISLAYDRFIKRPEMLSCLQLEYWDSKNRKWIPMPDDIEVEAWDWDPISPNDLQGRGRIKNGKVEIVTIYKDEEKPDIFFKIKANECIMPDGRRAPKHWSTKEMPVWRLNPSSSKIEQINHKGYYDDYRKYYIGHPTRYEIFRFGKSIEAHIAFEAWNHAKNSYQPFPESWKVEVIDYDPVSNDEVIGSAMLDSNGKCSISIDNKDEKEPDIYFKVYTDERNIGNYKLPREISTINLNDKKGRPGYYKDFTKKEIATASDPLIFQYGKVIECFVKFEIEKKGKKVPILDGTIVESWDYDPLSKNEKIGEGKSVGGVVHITSANKDERKPDIFFIVRGGDKYVNNVLIPDNWSTKDHMSTDGKKGYFNNFEGKSVGSYLRPITFIIK